MKLKVLSITLVSYLLLTCSVTQARDFAYFGLEPDIVTNYISTTSRNIGYVHVTMELMLNSSNDIKAAEHHSPLLRATAIDIFGRQTEERVKSLTGREEIRQALLQELRKKMKAETGSEMIRDVIFTKYLYQG